MARIWRSLLDSGRARTHMWLRSGRGERGMFTGSKWGVADRHWVSMCGGPTSGLGAQQTKQDVRPAKLKPPHLTQFQSPGFTVAAEPACRSRPRRRFFVASSLAASAGAELVRLRRLTRTSSGC